MPENLYGEASSEIAAPKPANPSAYIFSYLERRIAHGLHFDRHISERDDGTTVLAITYKWDRGDDAYLLRHIPQTIAGNLASGIIAGRHIDRIPETATELEAAIANPRQSHSNVHCLYVIGHPTQLLRDLQQNTGPEFFAIRNLLDGRPDDPYQRVRPDGVKPVRQAYRAGAHCA